MSAIKKIFVSSSFHESFEFGFNDERKLLKDKINGEDDLTDNSLDHGHPEASQGTEEASLQRVGESQLVVFLLGRRYGTIRENGLSLTHEEYNEAVRLNKPKLCYEFPINPSDEDYEVCLEFREQIKKKDDCIVLNIEDEIKKGNFSSVFSEVVKKKSAGEKQEPNEVEKKDYALDLANKILHDIIRQFKNTRYRSFQYVPPIPEDYFPRDTHIEAIKEKLEKNKGVVVSGMSGIGKTTLSIILGNDNNLKNDFKDGIYYLKMGQDPDLEDKQNDLLLHLENSNSKGTLKEIIKQDFADRKALLILDDIWNPKDFLPFNITKQETRSKIIITTRYGIQSFGVLDGFSEYLIEQLNEDESLAMLKQKIGWSTTDSELETICKRMSKKCGGLPLAISAVARVLATDENLKRWQDVENDFETILEKIPADEENRTVYASFQLSLKHLEEELRDRYFSLSILFNKHSSFFESETLRVYWGSNSWYILKSLKEASLLTEQISRKGQKQYTLHDLQKTFIKEKTKEPNLTNYKKQFIQNYQKKYAPDWHKIPFYEQGSFYYNYLEICKDLNEQSLAKEISEDILYNNPDISLNFVKKTADFLELDLIKEAPKILKTNQNSRVVVLLLNDLEPPKQKIYAQNYLKEPALKAESSFVTEKCIEILGTDDEQVRTFAQNYLKEPALKAESSFVIEKCIEILGTDDEQVRTFALNLREGALRKDIANGYYNRKSHRDTRHFDEGAK